MLIESQIFENAQLAYEILDKHKKAFALLTAKDVLEIRIGIFNGMIALISRFLCEKQRCGSPIVWEVNKSPVCFVGFFFIVGK